MAAAVVASPSPARGLRAFDFDYRSPARMENSPLPCRTGCSDKLEELCASSQLRLKLWRKERGAAMSSRAQRGLQEILREEDAVEDLQADLNAVEELTESARHFRQEGSKLGEAVLQSMKAAGNRAEVMAKAKQMLFAAKEDYEKELLEEQKRLQEAKEASRVQQKAIEDFLQRYNRSVGLEISRVSPQTMRLCFTLIDQAEPSREFSVLLGLAREGFVVSGCSPEVPELAHLLETLNQDSTTACAVPRFTCALRRAFKKMV